MDKNIMWLLQSIIEGFGADVIMGVDLGGKYSNYVDVIDDNKVYRYEVSVRKLEKEEEERVEY